LSVYKVFKTGKEDPFDKSKKNIAEALEKRLEEMFSHVRRGGAPDISDPKLTENRETDKTKELNIIENSPFSYFTYVELDLFPGEVPPEKMGKIPAMKRLYLSCNNTKENIRKSISEIKNETYKQKSLTPEEMLKLDPNFPVDKFYTNYKPNKKTPKKPEREEEEEEDEEEDEKTGGNIMNPYKQYPSYLKDILEG